MADFPGRRWFALQILRLVQCMHSIHKNLQVMGKAWLLI